MSRTIRRKGMKYPKGWYSVSREEFTEWKEEYESGSWRQECRRFNYLTGEWTTYMRKWYHREVTQHSTFESFEAFQEAWFHSDAGYPVYNHHISADFRRCIERKFRSQRNQQLRSAISRGEEEDLMITPFRHDISWWY